MVSVSVSVVDPKKSHNAGYFKVLILETGCVYISIGACNLSEQDGHNLVN